METIGTHLKELRLKKGYSLMHIEDNTGISNSNLSQIENGKISKPSPDTLSKLSKIYEVPFNDLMQIAGHPTPEASDLVNRIEGEIKRTREISKPIKSFAEDAKKIDIINSLFKDLEKNSKLKSILFLHRYDLFGLNFEMQVPYIGICTIPKGIRIDEITDNSKALEQIISSELGDVEDKFKNFLENNLGISDSDIQDAKDIAVYHLILLLRSNSKMVKLASGKEFDYLKMKKVLGDYNNTFNIIEHFSRIFASTNALIDPIITKKTEKLILKMVDKGMINIDHSLENFSQLSPQIIFAFHKPSMIRIISILKKTNLEYEDYESAMDDLYRHKLIETRDGFTWCENCSVESLLYRPVVGNIAPSKLKKDKCLHCDKKMSFSALYGLNGQFKDMFYSKDGLISVYLAWLLDKNSIEFEAGKDFAGVEADFFIKKSILVECKVFKSDKDEVAIRQEIHDAKKQINRQIQAAKKSGIEIKKAYLLWNRSINSGISFEENPEDVIKIISPDQMEKLVAAFK
jgi:transcriptional regulator with XRE-family HTH domain